METYQAFYQNEIRALEITVNDQDGNPFESDAASASVLDSNDSVIVAETTAAAAGSTVSTVINRAVTGTTGNYKIVWKLRKSGYIYYHVTELEITEL